MNQALTSHSDMEINVIHNLNCLSGLKLLPDNSIDCCVTSPPYYSLRDYGHEDQLGTEATPEEYIIKMTEVFEEVRRVLKPHGTLWLNLGDSYASQAGGYDTSGSRGTSAQVSKKTQAAVISGVGRKPPIGLKPKDLIGVPWMMAFSLRSAGWFLRQDIIWHKPNPMPESVTDRCTKSHEYIFLLSKSAKYYFDAEAIRTPLKDESIARLAQDIENQKGSERVPGKTNGTMKAVGRKEFTPDQAGSGSGLAGHSGYFDADGNLNVRSTANKKSVWTVTTKPFKGSHFATFPEDLIVDMIKAGCPEDGIVLDPFMGAGTTALVARKLNRNFIGTELNPEYVKIANTRLKKELGFFL